ncbi:MAG: zinc-ribbon domain-containing protein [Candidatus Cloacimonetes bacterium]|nr:zinc-ribbon domain-containing protein [Candidatus Cloacimonadota bacterium]
MMPFCKRCGKEISANLKVCPVCGAKINYIRDEDDVYDEDFDLDDELGLDELDIDDDEEDEDSYEDDYEDDFADLEDEDD